MTDQTGTAQEGPPEPVGIPTRPGVEPVAEPPATEDSSVRSDPDEPERGTSGLSGPSVLPRLRVVTLLLFALLGLGAAVAVRVADPPASLAWARPDALARALNDLAADGRRVEAEVTALEQTRRARIDDARDTAEIEKADREARTLAVLAGTTPVSGPGITIIVTDPLGTVDSWILVDALQELRDAGAEAIELSGVRVVVSTYVVERPGGGMTVDGAAVSPPYRLVVVGDPGTLAKAMRIPGGVLDTVATRNGAQAGIETSDQVEILTVRPAPSLDHAVPVA